MKDAKGHGSNKRGSMGRLDIGAMTPGMQRILGKSAAPARGAAHQQGVEGVGLPTPEPTKWAQRQMWNVQNLQIPPRDDVTMTKFQADQIGDSVLVHRAYFPNHAPSLSYSEGFQVGPRGRVKQMYSTKSY